MRQLAHLMSGVAIDETTEMQGGPSRRTETETLRQLLAMYLPPSACSVVKTMPSYELTSTLKLELKLEFELQAGEKRSADVHVKELGSVWYLLRNGGKLALCVSNYNGTYLQHHDSFRVGESLFHLIACS